MKGDALLEPCFGMCCIDFALLNHNHFGICAKAFRGAAPWNMPPVPLPHGTVIQMCDGAGKLSLEGPRDHPNGSEFAWLCDVGHLCEVLDGKIEQEEPTAAAVISRALNMKNEVALLTTELQACDCLTGQISFQMSQNCGQ